MGLLTFGRFSPLLSKNEGTSQQHSGPVLPLVVTKDSGASDANGAKAPVPLGPKKLSCFWPWDSWDSWDFWQLLQTQHPTSASNDSTWLNVCAHCATGAPAALRAAAGAHPVAGDLWRLTSSCPAAPGMNSELPATVPISYNQRHSYDNHMT